MRTLAIAAFITLVAHAGMVQAQNPPAFIDGNDLLARCQGYASNTSADQAYDRGVCLGYIEGVSDFLDHYRAANGLGPCPSGGGRITAGQVKDIVIRALTADPAHRHFAADNLVINAIEDAWHCHR